MRPNSNSLVCLYIMCLYGDLSLLLAAHIWMHQQAIWNHSRYIHKVYFCMELKCIANCGNSYCDIYLSDNIRNNQNMIPIQTRLELLDLWKNPRTRIHWNIFICNCFYTIFWKFLCFLKCMHIHMHNQLRLTVTWWTFSKSFIFPPKHLPKLPRVEVLIMDDNHILDLSGLNKLARAPLKYLSMKGTPVSFSLNYRQR